MGIKTQGDSQSLSFALANLSDEKVLVDVGDDTSSGNGGLDEKVELLVSSDRQLQMSGGDSSDFEVLGSVSGEFEHLSGQVLENGCGVDSGCRSHSVSGRNSALQEAVDSSDWELQTCTGRLGLSGSLGLSYLTSFSSLASFASFSCHIKFSILSSSLRVDLNLATLQINFDWFIMSLYDFIAKTQPPSPCGPFRGIAEFQNFSLLLTSVAVVWNYPGIRTADGQQIGTQRLPNLSRNSERPWEIERGLNQKLKP